MPDRTLAGAAWTEVERPQFLPLWEAPPAIIVLAAAPGWGKSVWMRQFAAHLARERPSTRVVTLAGRQSLESLLEAVEQPEASTTVFVDALSLTYGDALWPKIAATAGPSMRFVIATLDTPALELLEGAEVRVLDERELHFSQEELTAVIAANASALASDARDALSLHLRGCPFLVRRQIERVNARKATKLWASVEFTFEGGLIDHTIASVAPDVQAASAFIGLLRAGARYRRFSAEMIARDDHQGALSAQFPRLRASPLGEFDTDDETGQDDFVWSTGAWQKILALTSRAEQERDSRLALSRATFDGRITTQLYYLLQLGEYEAADALVYDQMRRFLLFTNAITQDALLAIPAEDLASRPHLLLLASELRLRAQGANLVSLHDAQRSLSGLPRTSHESPIGTFRMLCRRGMAAAFSGHRDIALDCLQRVAESVDRADGSAVLRAADRDRAIADRLAGDLFLAFWTAVQVDRHDLALLFAELMGAYGDPADLVTRIDQLTVMTEDDFAGLRSLTPEGTRPEGLEFSHAAPLVLLEESAEREAMERTHPVASRTRNAPTRSAADALMLLSQALVAPESLTLSRIDATITLSREFWSDKQPSTFIVFAAVVALVAHGRTPLAQELVRAQASTDWFVTAAAAIVALADDDARTALALLESPRAQTTIPRLRVVAAVLNVNALVRLNLQDAASARLDALWNEVPAPRLLRFALRFLTPDDFDALRACTLSTPTAEVLAASAEDRRPLGRETAARLTGAEREVLTLLRAGASNAEIATSRGVTSNTLRTQLRNLYRKLGVESRVQAVASAERLGLFEQ